MQAAAQALASATASGGAESAAFASAAAQAVATQGCKGPIADVLAGKLNICGIT